MGLRLSITFCLVIFVLFGCTYAQLTFSPNWGKRSSSNSIGLGNAQLNNVADANSGNGCKTSVESLMLIYRLIQNEAQRLIECSQK